VGAFVTAPGNGLGTGKLVAVHSGYGTVEYFDVPVVDGRIERKVALPDLRAVVLERQTRVWWDDGARWHVGRVDRPPGEPDEPYLVAFPDGNLAPVPGPDLNVRWSRPLTDPLRLLTARTVETRYFHIHRSRFLSTLLEQRAACDDLGGILSSSVELHLHQVAAARRVLSDPVQRYLLADEVGLGKTIEAGMVIRQVLVDDAAARILVLVPEGITSQWEDELETKFRTSWFSGTVEVFPHSWLAGKTKPGPIDLLVVDEVHRLTSWGSGRSSSSLYERLRPLAVESPRLLLLSATPVRSNEDTFLKMLHLLDPQLYPLGDLEGFQRRVVRRDDVALAVTSLAEGTPLFLLPEVVARLRGTFPDDGVLAAHLDALDGAIATADETVGAAAARAVKIHVSETYRLHRRLIRTRRNERLQATFPVRLRRRGDPWTLVDPDPARTALVSALDAFRVAVATETTVDPVAALRLVAGRLGAARPAIAGLAVALKGGKGHDLDGDDAALAAALGRLDSGRALGADIKAGLGSDPDADRISAMVDWAWRHVGRAKLAACSEFTSVAQAARDGMRERYGEHRVAALLSDMTSGELADQLEKARDDPMCVLLACDRVAEEGWNLQFVDAVLHLDLPWSVSRLEQRLGRFDRFAGQSAVRAPIRSVTVADEGHRDRLTGAWRRVLDEGFGVFERSTASLQYVLPEYEEQLLHVALDQGFGAMAEGLDKVGADLDLIRRRIDGQDLFDSVDDTDEEEAYLESLKAIDDEAGMIRGAFNGWLSGALRFSPFSSGGGTGYGVKAQSPPLLPETTLYGLGLHLLRHVYVDSRRDAIRRPGNGFLRWGEPLVDRFVEQAERDDRGHAFAVRRRHPNIPEGTPFRPIFRFDVKISASLDALEPVAKEGTAERLAIERRLQRYLAPWIEGVWLSPRLDEVPEAIQALLEDHRDFDDNLAKRPDEFDELVSGLDWRQLCADSAAAALAVAARRERCITRTTDARSDFRRDAAGHRAQDAARLAHLGGAAGIGAARPVEEAMDRALATPALQVESCGVVFLGPRE
jgi:ATP-dependent helicase HepA